VRRNSSKTRGRALLACGLGLSLILTACGGDEDEPGGDAKGADVDCAAFEEYGDLSGKTVSVYTSIITPEDKPHIDSYKPFEDCTGAKVEYEGSKEFEAQLPIRIEAGNPPDIAYLPQPGSLRTLVEQFPDAFVAAPEAVNANIDENFDPAWKEYGSVDGTFYAAPLGSNVKSFVWYSPAMFEENGWEIPTTLDELMTLSDTIAETGIKPWCAGIGSGDATGWPVTDWLEDFMLRTAGPEVYDQWLAHEIPFDDPQVTEALDAVGEILKNEDYVNGGLGNVQTIASTTFQEGGIPILRGECAMHRQASFYGSNFAEAGAEIGEDGDVFAFYLPAESADEKPVLVAGEFTAAFSDRPEVQAFLAYLSSAEWANAKAALSTGWVSANKNADPENFKNPIDRLSVEIIQDPNAVTRFDASDLMPGAVNTEFWRQMTDWITGKDTGAALSAIDASWP
jgi:alpha-glucoside transport system substrate-binding protein